MSRLSFALAGLLVASSVGYADSKPAPAASKPATSASKPAATAYVCNSKIGGTVPQVGVVHHSSVAICPAGQKPTTTQNGTSVNNPRCTYYGTQPGTSTFRTEAKRVDVTCKPAQAPASVVQQRVNTFNQPYKVLTNNCQHAAAKATQK